MRTIRMAVLATLVSASAAQAQLIGSPGTGGNSFPFSGVGNGFAGTRYQQVYNSDQFATARTITGVRFFANTPTGVTTTAATWRFRLSTTSAAVNGLNTTNFDANLGGNVIDVLNITTGNVAVPSALTFNFTNGFLYNPAGGNLLLDISLSGIVSRGTGFYQARNGDFGTTSSRAHNFGTDFASWGLVTEFLVGPTVVIPEPSTYALMATGLVALGVVARRRRRA